MDQYLNVENWFLLCIRWLAMKARICRAGRGHNGLGNAVTTNQQEWERSATPIRKPRKDLTSMKCSCLACVQMLKAKIVGFFFPEKR